MKQLILCADMEGASSIFKDNASWMRHGSADWLAYGRDCITSDALAICSAALDFGIGDILLYDGHYAGLPEFNIKREALPKQVRVFDVPDRRFFWRRMQAQAQKEPFGIITFGQHARFGAADAYFPHTIQSPPIRGLFIGGLHIAEIGTAVLSFPGAPYLANVGCAASMQEALELSDTVVPIAVKDKATGWEPTPEETYPLIYEGVAQALHNAAQAKAPALRPPYPFVLELCDGCVFNVKPGFLHPVQFSGQTARWDAPDIATGLEIFNDVRAQIRRAR